MQPGKTASSPLARLAAHLVWRSVAAAFEQGAHVAVGPHEGGRIHNPAISDLLEAPLRERVENGGAPQGVQQATGLKLAGVGRITPAWTYWTLAGLSVMMLLGEAAAFALGARV